MYPDDWAGPGSQQGGFSHGYQQGYPHGYPYGYTDAAVSHRPVRSRNRNSVPGHSQSHRSLANPVVSAPSQRNEYPEAMLDGKPESHLNAKTEFDESSQANDKIGQVLSTTDSYTSGDASDGYSFGNDFPRTDLSGNGGDQRYVSDVSRGEHDGEQHLNMHLMGSQLDTEAKKGSYWSEAEDAILMKMHLEFGPAWSKIAPHIPGRSSAACKYRWYVNLSPAASERSASLKLQGIEPTTRLWNNMGPMHMPAHMSMGGSAVRPRPVSQLTSEVQPNGGQSYGQNEYYQGQLQPQVWPPYRREGTQPAALHAYDDNCSEFRPQESVEIRSLGTESFESQTVDRFHAGEAKKKTSMTSETSPAGEAGESSKSMSMNNASRSTSSGFNAPRIMTPPNSLSNAQSNSNTMVHSRPYPTTASNSAVLPNGIDTAGNGRRNIDVMEPVSAMRSETGAYSSVQPVRNVNTQSYLSTAAASSRPSDVAVKADGRPQMQSYSGPGNLPHGYQGAQSNAAFQQLHQHPNPYNHAWKSSLLKEHHANVNNLSLPSNNNGTSESLNRSSYQGTSGDSAKSAASTNNQTKASGAVAPNANRNWQPFPANKRRVHAWTEEEDAIVLDMHVQHGFDWEVIAQALPGRTATAISCRWYSHLSFSAPERVQTIRPCYKSSLGKNLLPSCENQPGATKEGEETSLPPPSAAVQLQAMALMAAKNTVGGNDGLHGLPGLSSALPLSTVASQLNSESTESATTVQPQDFKYTPAQIRKGVWTTDEDNRLVSLVKTHGARNWRLIAIRLGGRTSKQCQSRYTQHLAQTQVGH
jgi:hypothetical protein